MASEKQESEENELPLLHSLALQNALQKRQDYLNSLPSEEAEKALALQEWIDSEMKKAGNLHNRLVVLQSLLIDSLKELQTQAQEFSNECTQVSSQLESDSNPSSPPTKK